jgi:FecR protein
MVKYPGTKYFNSINPLFIVLSIINCFQFLYSQDNLNQNYILLLGTIIKLENSISKADEYIRVYENAILKCEKTIASSEKIISLAREKGNTEAEKVAGDALLKSTDAKEKNIKLLNSAKLRKKQSEIILASVKNKVSVNSKNSPLFDAVALNYYGEITILKQDGKQFKLNDTQSSLLEAGDIITTSQNSKIELQFLEGRGNMTIGENTKLKFNKQDSTDVVDLIKGEVKLGVEKIDEYENDLLEQYEKYKQTVTSIPESYEQFIISLRAKYRKKFEVRTPSFAIAVRGTEFLVYNNEKIGSEIIVLEGTVEMKSTNGLNAILINAGQKGTVNEEGILSEPTQIDITKLEKWWEDEQ